MGSIYALSDPRTDEVRYVGKTTRSLGRRLSAHLQSSKLYYHYSARWISSLMTQGVRPTIELVEEVDGVTELSEAERFWISQFRALGFKLTNTTDGGDGGCGKGRVIALSHRAKLAEAARRQWADPVRRAATEAGLRITAKKPEFRKKVSDGKTGGTRNDAVAMSRRRGGRPFVDQRGNSYQTVNGCARQLGVPATEVSKVLRGLANHTHGFVFRFSDV